MVDVFDAKAFRVGQKLLVEGEPGDCAYLIESGKVEVYKTVDGKRVVLNTVGEGAMLGEMALIDRAPRMASAEAVTTTLAIIIDRKVLDSVVASSHPIVKALLMAYVKRLRELGQRASYSGGVVTPPRE
jgi:CRP-like cAMP-binding protein